MVRIKEILKEKGVTVEQLANSLGISRQALSKQLQGKMLVETAERIAAALDVPMWQLFENPENISSNNASISCPKCGNEIKIKVE